MAGSVRQVVGTFLVLSSIGILFRAVTVLGERDYLACVILVLTGLPVMKAGTELLRAVRP